MREILYLLSKYQLILALTCARFCALSRVTCQFHLWCRVRFVPVSSLELFGTVSCVTVECLHFC